MEFKTNPLYKPATQSSEGLNRTQDPQKAGEMTKKEVVKARESLRKASDNEIQNPEKPGNNVASGTVKPSNLQKFGDYAVRGLAGLVILPYVVYKGGEMAVKYVWKNHVSDQTKQKISLAKNTFIQTMNHALGVEPIETKGSGERERLEKPTESKTLEKSKVTESVSSKQREVSKPTQESRTAELKEIEILKNLIEPLKADNNLKLKEVKKNDFTSTSDGLDLRVGQRDTKLKGFLGEAGKSDAAKEYLNNLLGRVKSLSVSGNKETVIEANKMFDDLKANKWVRKTIEQHEIIVGDQEEINLASKMLKNNNINPESIQFTDKMKMGFIDETVKLRRDAQNGFRSELDSLTNKNRIINNLNKERGLNNLSGEFVESMIQELNKIDNDIPIGKPVFLLRKEEAMKQAPIIMHNIRNFNTSYGEVINEIKGSKELQGVTSDQLESLKAKKKELDDVVPKLREENKGKKTDKEIAELVKPHLDEGNRIGIVINKLEILNKKLPVQEKFKTPEDSETMMGLLRLNTKFASTIEKTQKNVSDNAPLLKEANQKKFDDAKLIIAQSNVNPEQKEKFTQGVNNLQGKAEQAYEEMAMRNEQPVLWGHMLVEEKDLSETQMFTAINEPNKKFEAGPFTDFIKNDMHKNFIHKEVLRDAVGLKEKPSQGNPYFTEEEHTANNEALKKIVGTPKLGMEIQYNRDCKALNKGYAELAKDVTYDSGNYLEGALEFLHELQRLQNKYAQ
ncbi:MAG: hypothetical protein H0U49_02460 [Parachlamydiaceae bacterium]|nr:hypothetical protein [Parachlamydiaceae bacterium]